VGDNPLSGLVEAPFAGAGMTAGTGVVEVVVSAGTEGIRVVEVVEVAGVGSVAAGVASAVGIGMVAALINGSIEWFKFKSFASSSFLSNCRFRFQRSSRIISEECR
jgi:hypothetical protein